MQHNYGYTGAGESPPRSPWKSYAGFAYEHAEESLPEELEGHSARMYQHQIPQPVDPRAHGFPHPAHQDRHHHQHPRHHLQAPPHHPHIAGPPRPPGRSGRPPHHAPPPPPQLQQQHHHLHHHNSHQLHQQPRQQPRQQHQQHDESLQHHLRAQGRGFSLKVHAAEFVPGKRASGPGSTSPWGELKPHAREFVPGGDSKSSKRNNLPTSASSGDLKAHAPEFIPGGSAVEASGTAAAAAAIPAEDEGERGRKDGEEAAAEEEEEGAEEGGGGGGPKMVQVVRGGCLYFVPEAEAAAEAGAGMEDLVYEDEEEAETGFEWALGSTALPAPQKRTLQTAAVPEQLWGEFQRQALETLRQLPPDDERLKEIPPKFYAAWPLDDEATRKKGTAGSFGYPSSTYKVINHHDGQAYALRRFDGVRTTAEIAGRATAGWLTLGPHPGLVRLHECFLHHGAVFFTCQYHAGARTLAQRFLETPGGGLLSERLLWSIACQLAAALRAIHAAGLACRNVQPARVLFSELGGRCRLNWLGCMDVLESETRVQQSQVQAQDMRDLGALLLSLGCRTPGAVAAPAESLAFLGQHYSADFNALVQALLGPPVPGPLPAGGGRAPPPPAHEVCRMTGDHMATVLESLLRADDALQSHLAREYDNGRLLRLLMKLGTVNERPGQEGHGSWAETGDRYVLKLFRDYCFHQVGTKEEPVLDFGHMYESLAKLDAGDPEQVLLTSRDKQSILVVSFQDIKRCLEEAFNEVFGESEGRKQPPGGGVGHGMGQAHGLGPGPTGPGLGGGQIQRPGPGPAAGVGLGMQVPHHHAMHGGGGMHMRPPKGGLVVYPPPPGPM